MLKRIVILIACYGLALQLTGCSLFSGEKKSDTSDAEATQNSDSADLEKLEGEDALQAKSTESNGEVTAQVDSKVDDALGESNPSGNQSSSAVGPAPTEVIPNNEAQLNAPSSNELPADPFAQISTSDATSLPAQTEDLNSNPAPQLAAVEMPISGTSSTEVGPVASSTTKAAVVLQKIAQAPWQVGKVWFNTVYIARPGDTLSKISQMIYGADKTAELKKGNKTLKNRSVRAGDKVYYNSPQRPDDAAKMITFYEDTGVNPELYVSKAGDNIVKVSKKLLGYSNAWKEVWATNSVESKDSLPEGTELRYWKANEAILAKNSLSSEASASSTTQETPNQMEKTADQMLPAADSNPSAIQASTAPQEQPMAQGGDIPPPPPMPEVTDSAKMAPPPPMPHQKSEKPNEAPAEDGAVALGDDSTNIILGVIGVATAGLAILIVRRKKNKEREAEMLQGMDGTHVT
jgi:LPXTG-motif cell wall-anchored protein